MKKNQSKELIWFIVFSFLSWLFFLTSRLTFFKDLRGFIEQPFLFSQATANTLKQKLSVINTFIKLGQVSWRENESLKRQIKELSLKSSQLGVCLEQNDSMRRLLAAPLPPSWHFIPAKAISFYQKIKINVGEKAGVEKGLTVVSENFLLGRIESTEKFSSVVILATDPSLKIPVVVRASGVAGIKAKGILSGYYQEQMVLEQVLKSEKISQGDFVYTSGEGDWLPDLLIGKIDKIEQGEEKVFQKAWVNSFLDYQNLRYIFVVRVV